MRTQTSGVLPVLAAAAVLMLAGAAHGQHALGDGRALDRNLQSNSGGALPGRRDSLQDTLRFNNAVIHGTATGGKSFRGVVGYRATDQFGGHLGSDDIYYFKRDSMAAESPAFGVRGTDALRYQFGATTGNIVPAYMVAGPGTLARSGTVTTSGTPNALRSTSEFLAARAVRPSVVGQRQDEWGAQYVAQASPLLGVSWTKTRASPLEAAARTDLKAPLGQPTPPPPGAFPAPSPLSGLESSVPGVPNGLDRVAENETPRPAPPNQIVTRVMNELRTEVGGRVDPIAPIDPTRPPNNANPLAGSTPAPGATPGTAAPGQPPGTLPGTTAPGTVPTAPTPPEPQTLELQLERLRASMRGEVAPKTMKDIEARREAEKKRDAAAKPPVEDGKGAPSAQPPREIIPPDGLTPEMIRGLRKSGEKKVNSLIEPSAPGDPNTPGAKDMDMYQSMMTAGQTWLSKGRYFDAEDRFTRAIAAAPGDPMARAGRVNAQLGAGLFLSAAANLRTLLTDHPELVATRYAENLMPSADRSGKVAVQLRQELNAPSSALQRDAAFLMAYLGYQREDNALIADGLAEFANRIDPENAKDEALLALIVAAWRK